MAKASWQGEIELPMHWQNFTLPATPAQLLRLADFAHRAVPLIRPRSSVMASAKVLGGTHSKISPVLLQAWTKQATQECF